jgi:hypothetical protein
MYKRKDFMKNIAIAKQNTIRVAAIVINGVYNHTI